MVFEKILNLFEIEQKLKNAFLTKFSILLRISQLQKANNGISLHQEIPLIFVRQLITSVGETFSKIISNFILNLLTLNINVLKKMLIFYFYFLQFFLKIQSCENCDKDKSPRK